VTQYEYDVFLSHNSRDKAVVHALAERLHADGLSVWLDDWIIKLGDSIPAKLMSGLEESRVLLMMLSKNFEDSDWAEYETGSFLFRDPKNTERRFIPVRLDSFPVRESLRQFAYLDWRNQEDEAYQRLLNACRTSKPTEVASVSIIDKSEAPEVPPKQEQPAPFSLGHTDWVRSVAITEDAKIAVTACDDGVVRVWDLKTNQCTATLEGHSGYVLSVALTPDGSTAVSGSDDNTVKVWDLKSSKNTATLEGHSSGVLSVALTADGVTAVSGSDDNTVKVWDLKSHQCRATLEGHSGTVNSVVLTADGVTAVSGSNDKTVKVWDLKSHQNMATLEGHSGTVKSVALTADGCTAVSGSNDKTVKVWDLKSHQNTATLEGHSDAVNSVVLTADGCTAVSGSYDDTIKVWDLKSNRNAATLEGHSDGVNSVVLTADGCTVVSGSDDNTVKVWDLKFHHNTATLEGHTDDVNSVALTADGGTVVSGSDDKTVKVWDLQLNRNTATLEGHSGIVWSVALTADGKTAVSGSDDKTVKVWDLKSNQNTATLEGHSDCVNSVVLTADGCTVVSGSNDKTVKVWDLKSHQNTATLEGHSDDVNSVALTADGGTVVSGSGDKTVKVWDLKSNTCRATLEGHFGEVNSVALTPDGVTVVSGSDDYTLKVWDLKSNTCTATLEGHSDAVNSVVLTADGKTAVSGSDDKTVKVWDLKSNQCRATFEGHFGEVSSVALTPEGPFDLVSVAYNGVIREWRWDVPVSQAARPPAVRYTNAKVLLVGESRVGKTGLAMRIARGEWAATESTDGHWATRLSADYHDDKWATRLKLADEVTAEGVQREIWLWDFAGQSDYRLIHQLFMDQTSLVVLVFDPQCDRLFDTLGRWDHDIKLAARGAYAKLLVAARTDVGVLRVSQESLNAFIEQRKFAHYQETSAKNNIGCDELVQAIGANINWEAIPVTGSNQTYDRLKTEILKLRDAGVVLVRLSELNQIIAVNLPDLRFTLPELTTVVGHLAAPGLVWNLEFGNFVLLHPEKINTYAGAVIRTLRDTDNELGIISEADIKSGKLNYAGMERLSADDEEVVLQAMYQAFVKRGLCIQQQTDQGNQLVFPAFFGAERPEYPDSPSLLVTYEFAGFLDDIYATLVVRLHQTSAFEKKSLWKDYAEFMTESRARVALRLERGKEGKGLLRVHVDHDAPEDEKVVFSRYVHQHLAEKGGEILRTRQYMCQKCGRVFKDHEETRDVLSEDGAAAVVTCTNRKCKADIPLWDAIERKFASPKFQNQVKTLQEFALQQIDNQDREQILIGHAFSIAGEAGQIFRPVTNADYGIDGEIEFKDYEGHPCGQRVYLQLKSGDSYLRSRQRDKSEVFDIKKPRWAEYWIQHEYPVMLVIRSSDGQIRWFNATEYLKQKQAEGEWPVKQIVFDAEDFSPLNLLKKRKELLGPRPERIKTEE